MYHTCFWGGRADQTLAKLWEMMRKEVSDEEAIKYIDILLKNHPVDDYFYNSDGAPVGTLLSIAATSGRLTIVTYLVESKNASVDTCSRYSKWTPLIEALLSGSYRCALYLLQQGANPKQDNSQPLRLLCKKYREQSYKPEDILLEKELITRLIQKGADIDAVFEGLGLIDPKYSRDKLHQLGTIVLDNVINSTESRLGRGPTF